MHKSFLTNEYPLDMDTLPYIWIGCGEGRAPSLLYGWIDKKIKIKSEKYNF